MVSQAMLIFILSSKQLGFLEPRLVQDLGPQKKAEDQILNERAYGPVSKNSCSGNAGISTQDLLFTKQVL